MTSKMISCSECSWGRPWTCDSSAFTSQVVLHGHALSHLLGGTGHWTQDLLHTRQALHHRGYIMAVGLRPSLSLELCFDDINTAIIRLKEKVSGNSDTKGWCYNLNLENSRGRNGSDMLLLFYVSPPFFFSKSIFFLARPLMSLFIFLLLSLKVVPLPYTVIFDWVTDIYKKLEKFLMLLPQEMAFPFFFLPEGIGIGSRTVPTGHWFKTDSWYTYS